MMTDKAKNRLIGGGLFLASLVMYVFSFPMGKADGLSFLSFFAIAPLFVWIRRARWRWLLPAGMLYGAAVYGLGGYWLYNFYPAALFLSMTVATLRFGPLFLAIKLANGKPWLKPAIPLLWAATDTIASMGFLAFPYLTLPYSLYNSGPALALAGLGGMSLISTLIGAINLAGSYSIEAFINGKLKSASGSAARFRLFVGLACSLACALVFLVPVKPPANSERLIQAATLDEPIPEGMARIALLQPNTPHPQRTVQDYQRAFIRLKTLSDSLRDKPVDLVVWHETSVVPPIGWNVRFRDKEPTVYAVVRQVHDYLSAYPHPVVLGNGWSPDDDEQRRIRQNVALLYQNGGEDQRYAKMKLVPFSEHFPYEHIFPKLAAWLEVKFNYFWTAGTEFTILDTGKLRFAAPICFEDSFGPHFIRYPDPDIYVVLTQDAWAKSVAMQKQHKSMSVFRAAESQSIVLRVGNTGYTSAIYPGGAVNSELEPFTSGILVVDVALDHQASSFYRSLGQYFDQVVYILALAAISAGLAVLIRNLLDKKSRL